MFNFYGRGEGTFEAHYRCYPVSFIDKLDAENGDKIFLPPSALDRLASLQVEYPMLFRLENRKSARSTHCGVLEFIADEGMVYMPYWMMQNLVLEEGDIVSIRSAALPKGTFVKLQPHTQDFLDISNPKAVLERLLRGFSALTKGDCICLNYNNKKYFIDVIESKPQDAVSVIETDCEVDFAQPLDYVEPSRPIPQEAQPMEDASAGGESPVEPEEPKFQAFVGAGRRLDGKPATQSASPATQRGAATASGSGRPADGSSGTAANGAAKKKVAGKVVFGGGNRLLEKKAAEEQQKAGGAPPPAKPKPAEEGKEEEPKFKAFSGKPRSLKG